MRTCTLCPCRFRALLVYRPNFHLAREQRCVVTLVASLVNAKVGAFSCRAMRKGVKQENAPNMGCVFLFGVCERAWNTTTHQTQVVLVSHVYRPQIREHTHSGCVFVLGVCRMTSNRKTYPEWVVLCSTSIFF